MQILDLLLSLLYPARCPGCARERSGSSGRDLCRGCVAALGTVERACTRCGEPGEPDVCAACVAAPPPFGSARACFLYADGELASALVTRWKYRHDHLVGASLGRLLAAHRKERTGCYEVVVPVPLHRSRLASRGFNQAAVLARAALQPGERLVVEALARAAATPQQVALGRRDRAGNVRDAFTVRRPAALRDRTVLLVDDVLTSGATARACARTLLDAGAAAVDVWTLARTPRRAAAGRRLLTASAVGAA